MMLAATSGATGMKRSSSAGSLTQAVPPPMPRCVSCNSLVATTATAAALFTQAFTDDLNSLATHRAAGASLSADVVRHVQLQALTRAPVYVSGVCYSEAFQESSPVDRARSLVTCMATPIEYEDAEKKEVVAVRQVGGSLASAAREHCDTDTCDAEEEADEKAAQPRRKRGRRRRRGRADGALT